MINISRPHVIFALLFLALPIVPLEAWARIKLITLPVRERVEIQLDHPQATLVEEERIVPLVKGINQVDFSWANTRISPDSLIFRVLNTSETPDQAVKVLSVSYPPNENSLVWAVSSPIPVQLRYASAISWTDWRKSFTIGQPPPMMKKA